MGTSLAVTVVHSTSTAGDSSSSAVAARRSASVDGRRSPVSASSTKAAQPEEQKREAPPSCSSTSNSGALPPSTISRGHCARAAATSSGGMRTTDVASSTCAPRAASRGSTRDPAMRMPTRSSRPMASCTIRSFSASLSQVVRARMGSSCGAWCQPVAAGAASSGKVTNSRSRGGCMTTRGPTLLRAFVKHGHTRGPRPETRGEPRLPAPYPLTVTASTVGVSESSFLV